MGLALEITCPPPRLSDIFEEEDDRQEIHYQYCIKFYIFVQYNIVTNVLYFLLHYWWFQLSFLDDKISIPQQVTFVSYTLLGGPY